MVWTLGLAEHVDPKDKEKMKQYEKHTVFRLTTTTVEEDNKLRANFCVKIQHVASGFYLSTKMETTFEKTASPDAPKQKVDAHPSRPKKGNTADIEE